MMIDGKHYVDKTLAALACGIGVQTLNQYRNRENPPPFDGEHKMYPLKELGEWMRAELMFRKAQGGKPKFKDLFRKHGYIHQDDLQSAQITGLPGVDGNEGDFFLNEDQDVRYKRLRADQLEVKIAESAGQLIPVDEVSIAMTEMVTRVKMKLMSLPTSLSPLISGKDNPIEIQEIIEERVRAALEELSGDWKTEIENANEDEVAE